ncbi:MAG: histidinol phosphatase, partial [Bacteroidaceae bacterium]|nr:histidinol phosphatase [Bacteroidaceae bacterium]
MKANYHTHTSRCHHAEGTDEDYIKSAILGGFDILGFSDHAPWPYTTGFVSETRMLLSELPDYVNHILE